MLFKEFKPSDFSRYYDKRGQVDPELNDAILTDWDLKQSFKVDFNSDTNPDECEIIKVVATFNSDGDFDEYQYFTIFKGLIENAQKIEILQDLEIELNANGDYGFLY